jgi:cadmium resistance protein CadD (predicted permease)
MIKIAIIATVAFAATNIDDAFVLLAFFANKKVKDAHILVGQYIGMAALVIAAMLLSAVSVVLLPNDLGLLGALPIVIGLRQFWTAWSERGDYIIDITPGAGAFEVVELVAIRTIANGGDNIAVYIPLFAGQSRSAEILTCFVFAVLVGGLVSRCPLDGRTFDARRSDPTLGTMDHANRTYLARRFHFLFE